MMPSVSQSFDGPEGQLALLDSLRFAERCAAVSQVASVIAHVIGTPLQVIAGRAALIRFNPQSETVAENARRIEDQVERLAQRIRKLIGYLTSAEPSSEPRRVDELVLDALTLYEPIARRMQVTIQVNEDLPSEVTEGTPALIVLTSLLSLATRAAKPGDRIVLGAVVKPGSKLCLELSIPHLAVSKARIDRLDPPETDGTNPEHVQVLSVCNAIARQHGGGLEFDAGEGRTTVRYDCHIVTA
jgi:two-component system NtrC family sensor kinase